MLQKASTRCFLILGMHLCVPVAHADVYECATTSITAFRGGPPEPQQGVGDMFTFDTLSGVQRYVLPDTPAYRFRTPKRHIYAKRLEPVMGDRAKATAIIDEMMADKNIGEPEHATIEHKFDILSSRSSFSAQCVCEVVPARWAVRWKIPIDPTPRGE